MKKMTMIAAIAISIASCTGGSTSTTTVATDSTTVKCDTCKPACTDSVKTATVDSAK